MWSTTCVFFVWICFCCLWAHCFGFTAEVLQLGFGIVSAAVFTVKAVINPRPPPWTQRCCRVTKVYVVLKRLFEVQLSLSESVWESALGGRWGAAAGLSQDFIPAASLCIPHAYRACLDEAFHLLSTIFNAQTKQKKSFSALRKHISACSSPAAAGRRWSMHLLRDINRRDPPCLSALEH